MKLLFDNAPVAMAMFDSQMRYLLANRRWLEDFKLTKTDVTGRSQYELFPSLHPGWRQVYERALNGQIVRSDRDALTHDGKPIVYRWEVRPWRHVDTTVGGVMITCAQLYAAPAGTGPGPGPAESSPPPAEAGASLWSSHLPILALNDKGIIVRSSTGLTNRFLSKGMEVGATTLWQALGERVENGPLRQHVVSTLKGVLKDGKSHALITAYTEAAAQDAEVPAQWLVCRIPSDIATGTLQTDLALAIGLAAAPGDSPFQQAASDAPPVVAEIARLKEEISLVRQQLKASQESEHVSRNRENRLRSLLDLAPCGFLVLDERARPIYHNQQIKALFGRGVEEGENMEQWLSRGCRDEIHRDAVTRKWREGVWRKQLTLALTLATADGLVKDIEFRPVSLPGGGVMILLQDVTDALRGEEMLRSTEAKFRALVHDSPQAVILTDRTGSLFDANPAAEQLLGATRTELRREPLQSWLAPDALAHRTAALKAMMDRGDRFTDISVAVRPLNGGDSREVQMRLSTVPDSLGQPICTLHFMHEVSPGPIATEVETHLGTVKLMAEFEAMAGPVASPLAPEPESKPEIEAAAQPAARAESTLLTTDANGRVSSWTHAAVDQFGFSEAEALGRGLHTFFRPSDATGFYGELQSLAGQDGSTPEAEWIFYHRLDGRKSDRFTVTPIPDSGALAVTLGKHLSQESAQLPPEQSSNAATGTDTSAAETSASADPVSAAPEAAVTTSTSAFIKDETLEEAADATYDDVEDRSGDSFLIVDEEPTASIESQIRDHLPAMESFPATPPPPPVPAIAEEENAALSPTVTLAARPTHGELKREQLLLSETHHRVRNHLQIVTSMLNLQLSSMRDEEARAALRSSQNRVRSIASLHQYLQQLAAGEAGSFQDFANGLVAHLRDCYDVSEDRVRVDVDILSGAVPDDWLMPLAMSLNEMVSNSLTHAFPGDRTGHLQISMHVGGQTAELSVIDDGAGLRDGFDDHANGGLGLKILRVFAGQLGGEVQIVSPSTGGAEFRLIFPANSVETTL